MLVDGCNLSIGNGGRSFRCSGPAWGTQILSQKQLNKQSHSVLNQGLDLLARALDPTDGCSLGQRLREVWGCVCCSELVSRGSVLLSVVQSTDSPHPARDRTVCQPC